MKRLFTILLLVCTFFLVSCSSDTYAPVREVVYQPTSYIKMHKVNAGETLYAIAWQYDLDYRDLARYNQIASPYTISIGQSLRLTGAPRALKKAAPSKPTSVTATQRRPSKNISSTIRWGWPAKGRLINRFGQPKDHKGIDITGKKGSDILAAASGRVAYAGNGLRGYGNLLIIKHNDDYLSAYAHNSKLLVKEGDTIKLGQKIAKMGSNDTNRIKLHFEIRKTGKPVNPMNYLPSQLVS